MAGNSLSRRRRRRWQRGLCSQCISVYSYLPLSACVCVSLLWVALPPSADSDWQVVTELAAAPHYSVSGLINYPTQTQDMSSRAFSVYCSLKSASEAATPATYKTGSRLKILFFFLSFHLVEIMAHRTFFVKGVHMICLMALYLPCQSRVLSSWRLERGETERAHT